MWRMAVVSAAALQIDPLDEILLAKLLQQAIQCARPEQRPARQGGIDSVKNVDANTWSLGQGGQHGAGHWP